MTGSKTMTIKGSGGGSPSPDGNAKDTLFSTDAFEAVLGICEGQIEGLAGDTAEEKLQNLYLNDTPILNAQGTSNYPDSDLIVRYESGIEYTAEDPIDATTGQTPVRYLLGGAVTSRPISGGATLSQNVPVTQQLTPVVGGYDEIELHFTIQQLMTITDTGTKTASLTLKIEYKKTTDTEWLPYRDPNAVADIDEDLDIHDRFFGKIIKASPDSLTVSGKTSGGYSVSTTIYLPERTLDTDIYEVRVKKTSEDSSETLSSEVVWTGCELLTRKKDAYLPSGVDFSHPDLEYHPGTAMLHIIGVLGEQLNRLPNITGIWKGLLCRIPTNYDPKTKTYYEDVAWDGNYKVYKAWTDNPFWIANELILNTRMGMAKFNPRVSVNRYRIYELAKYADGYNLTTGVKDLTDPITNEPQSARYTFNGVITQAQSGIELINYVLGSAFAKAIDSETGEIFIVGDIPQQPVATITPEMCVASGGSVFNYTFTQLDSRHNEITATYIDPDLNWQPQSLGVLRDEADIAKNGVNSFEYDSLGCLNAGEVWRKMYFYLLTVQTEIRTVSFTLPLSGIQFEGFDVINICDPDVGTGNSGRLLNIDPTTKQLTFRDPLYFSAAGTFDITLKGLTQDYNLTFEVSAGEVDTPIYTITTNEAIADVSNFGDYPIAVISDNSVNSVGLPKPYRIIGISETEDGFYQVTASEINPNKYSDADNATITNVPKFSYIHQNRVQEVQNLRVVSITRASNIKGNQLNLWLGWDVPDNQPLGTYYEVTVYQNTISGGRWSEITSDHLIEIPNVDLGQILFSVTPIVNGVRAKAVSLDWEVAPVLLSDLQAEASILQLIGEYKNHRLELFANLPYQYLDPNNKTINLIASLDVKGWSCTVYDNSDPANPILLTTKLVAGTDFRLSSEELRSLQGGWSTYPSSLKIEAQVVTHYDEYYPTVALEKVFNLDATVNVPSKPTGLAYDNDTGLISWSHPTEDLISKYLVEVKTASTQNLVLKTVVTDTKVNANLDVGFYDVTVYAIGSEASGGYKSLPATLAISDTLPAVDQVGFEQQGSTLLYTPFAKTPKAGAKKWYFWYEVSTSNTPSNGTPSSNSVYYRASGNRHFELDLLDNNKTYVHLWFASSDKVDAFLPNGEPDPASFSNFNYIQLTNSWAGLSESELSAALSAKINEASASRLRFRGTFASESEVTNPQFGDVYSNSTDGNSYAYNGTVWDLFIPKGTQGVKGDNGADAYLHIAYADNASGGGFSQTPTDKTYMGTYVDSIATDSTDPTKYNWVKIKGESGQNGKDGAYISFIFYNSLSQPATPTGGTFDGVNETFPSNWTDEPTTPNNPLWVTWVSKTKYYKVGALWVKTGWSTPARFYEKGADGQNGADGKDGISPPRPPGSFYRTITGSTWSDTEAVQAIQDKLGAGVQPVNGDRVTLSNTVDQLLNSSTYRYKSGYNETRYYWDASWIGFQKTIGWRDIVEPPQPIKDITKYLSAEPLENSRAQKGDNLVVNGDGAHGDNYNFTAFTFDPLVQTNNKGAFKTVDSSTGTHYGEEMIPIDVNQKYEVAIDLKSSDPAAKYYIGLMSYDVDGLLIDATKVMYINGSLTSLAADLNNGDTVIQLTDASGFNKTTTLNYRKCILFWNYTNSKGYTYPPETYSRNRSVQDLWLDQSSFSGNTITLRNPWTGGFVAAGTKLSQANAGGSHIYNLVSGATMGDTDWHTFSNVISGLNNDGQANSLTEFRHGTAFVRVFGYFNYQGGSTVTSWIQNVTFKKWVETPDGAQLKADLAQAAAEAAAQAKADLAETQAKAYADGIVTVSEQNAINAAQAKADLAEIQAKAYADGIVSAEEARAIADAQAKADAAEAAAKQQEQDNRIVFDPDPVEGRFKFKRGSGSFEYYDVFSPTERVKLDRLRTGQMPTDPTKYLNNWQHVTGTGKPADNADVTNYTDKRIHNNRLSIGTDGYLSWLDENDSPVNLGVVTIGGLGGETPSGAQAKADAAYNSIKADPRYANNLLDINWTVGQSGTQGRFGQNGVTSMNQVVLGLSPFGYQEPIWQCTADAGSGADGGWNYTFYDTDGFNHTKAYRFIVWAKQQSSSGRIYLGCDTANNTVNLNNSANSNPYFISGFDLPTTNKWYLLVGILHGSGFTGSDMGIAGIYDPDTGKKVVDGVEYKSQIGATKQTHRAYNFYDTTVGNHVWFARPRVDELNGNEPSLLSLMSNNALLNQNQQWSDIGGTGKPADNANQFEFISDPNLGKIGYKVNGGAVQTYEAISQSQVDGRVIAVRPDSTYKNSNTTKADVGLPNVVDGADITAQNQFAPVVTWNFRNGADGWTWLNMTPSYGSNMITLTATSTDPIIKSPRGLDLDGSVHNIVMARVRRNGGDWQGTCYYGTKSGSNNHGESGSYRKDISAPPIGEWVTLIWDMTSLTAGGSDWVDSTIDYIRLDLQNSGSTGQSINIDWIAIGKMSVDVVSEKNISSGATNDLELKAGIDCYERGNEFGRTGTVAGWNRTVYSNNHYYNGASLYFKAACSTANALMVGINFQKPLTETGKTYYYQYLDFAFYLAAGGGLYVYESGISRGNLSTWTEGDLFLITYDGSTVKYFKNGTVIRTVTGVGSGNVVWLQADMYSATSRISNVSFNPLSSNNWADVGGSNKPADNANQFEFISDPNLGKIGYKINGGAVQTYEAITQAQVDGRVVAVRPDATYKNSNTTPSDIGYTGDLDATKGATWGVDVYSRPVELTDGRIPNTINSNRQLVNQTNIPMVNSAGAMASLASNPISAVDAGSTATINIAAHTVQFGHGTVSYNSGSITGLAFSTKYYIYCDDANYSGGAVTYYASTTPTAVTAALGRRYISYITTPANGGSGTTPPNDTCVLGDMWLTDELQAKDAKSGDVIDCWWRSKSHIKSKIAGVQHNEPTVCFEIETRSGAKLQLSATTPIETQYGAIVYPANSLGAKVGVLINDVMHWESVVKVQCIGEQPVTRIYIYDNSYAAGVDPSKRIFTHNIQLK